MLQKTATDASLKELQRGVWEALPVMASFVPVGLVLGAQAVQKEGGF